MKKVLIVIPTLLQGGGQKFVLDLATQLDKSKYQVRVLVYFDRYFKGFKEFLDGNQIDTVYLNKQLGLDLSFFKRERKNSP